MADRTCRADECSRPATVKGLCRSHYDKARHRRRSVELAAKYRAKHPLTERTCGGCGSSFMPARASQIFCRVSCRPNDRHYTLQCSVCAAKMFRQKLSLPDGEAVCLGCRSKRRAERGPWRPPPPPKACSDCGVDITGMNRRTRCVSCSKQAERERKRKRTLTWTCPACGDLFTFPETSKKTRSPFCSQRCRAGLPPTAPPPTETLVPWASCRFCRGWFVARQGRKLCRRKECEARQRRSKATRISRHARAKRRREAINAGEEFSHEEIFIRDGYRCGICGKPTDPAKVWPHPDAPSLDHIVPLQPRSGPAGDHTKANVQCAHLGCNWSKNNRVMGDGEQLRLIG